MGADSGLKPVGDGTADRAQTTINNITKQHIINNCKHFWDVMISMNINNVCNYLWDVIIEL